jgi:predicted RNase H-like nuclease
MAEDAADHYVGITWCGESWLAVAFTAEGFDHVTVCDGIGDCWAAYEETARRILVDLPVGLVESGDPARRCDDLARRVLGPQAGTVYTPPVREATRKRRYSTAGRVHERKSGDPLSEAAFEARDGIAMLDELLQEVPEAAAVIRSSHPELCFRALAGDPLEQPRETAAGYAERMRVLAHYDRDAAPTVQRAAEETAGHTVTVADVLDAVVLAYTAAPGDGSIRTLPPEPPTDAKGLPMELVYRASAALSGD